MAKKGSSDGALALLIVVGVVAVAIKEYWQSLLVIGGIGVCVWLLAKWLSAKSSQADVATPAKGPVYETPRNSSMERRTTPSTRPRPSVSDRHIGATR